jgi:hypothetical protein
MFADVFYRLWSNCRQSKTHKLLVIVGEVEEAS